MNLLLLVVALGLTGASPLQDDKVCQPHSRPWQVHWPTGRVSCSGALINNWWLVTSFQCAPTYGTIVSLGEHDVTVDEGTEQHIYVADVIRHSPYYRSPFHSLAMVRLAEPARFTEHVRPIPLPSRCPRPGEICHVSGWGSTVPNQSEPSKLLKCISVPVVGDQVCLNTFPEYLHWSMGMVCAGQANTDNCMRDSGSVMVCDGQLQGVQWFSHGCHDPADPSVYTKLCMYNNWIRDVMDRFGPILPTTTPPGQTTP